MAKPFELLDDPPWADDYLQLRRDQNRPVEDECNHLADVALCCEVDQFRPIPFPLIPAWIRRSLLGRSTYGRISPLPELGLEPYSVLDRLIEKPEQAERPWTSDVAEVERRLVDAVGPNTFEHLCVALFSWRIQSMFGRMSEGAVMAASTVSVPMLMARLSACYNASGLIGARILVWLHPCDRFLQPFFI